MSYTVTYSDGSTFTIYNGTKGDTGEKGDKGDDGTGIYSVEKTDSDDLTDTYTITLTNGDKYTFTITNGESAYRLYKETYGYTGTEKEWLYDLVNGNLSYKATYTVTFDYNDGATESYSVTVAEGSKIARPDDPERDGYTFDGWYCSGEQWSFIGYAVTEDITLTARWTEDEKETNGLQYTLNSDYLSYTVSGYTGTDTEVYIPSTRNGLTVSQIGANAFYGNTDITYIELPDKITVIGDYAFYGCTALSNIELSAALAEIGSDAFNGCSSLTSVTIPDGVASLSSSLFYGCSSLVSITIGSGVKSIGNNAFSDCSSLESVTFKNTSGWYVTTTENADSGDTVDVTTAGDNTTYLTSTYVYYYWYVSES